MNNERYETNLSVEYEQCFLGGLLYLQEPPAGLKINENCFYNPTNKLIFKTFIKQHSYGIKPDIKTLANDPDLAADTPYIAEITNKNFSAANIEFYEKEIIKAWQKREAIIAANRLLKDIEGTTPDVEIETHLREFIGKISGAIDDFHADSFISFDSYIKGRANREYWREFSPQLFNGILPFPDGTISAIGAAPGGGKSAVLINLCRELLTAKPTNNSEPKDIEKAQDINAKRKILFISAEMSTEDLTDRLIHSLAWQKAKAGSPYFLETVEKTNTDYWKQLKKEYGQPPEYWLYSEQELKRVELYKDLIETHIKPNWGNRLKIAYVRGRKCFEDIYQIILNNAEQGTLVLMDYLQLMPICNSDIGDGNPRYLEIRHIMDTAIIAAEKTQSVIIAAAQLGREDRKNGNKGDETQGWRESGDIEQTAWNLIKMTRNLENENITFKIAKARNSGGVSQAHSLLWVPKYQYMEYGGKLANEKQQKKKDTAQNGAKKIGTTKEDLL